MTIRNVRMVVLFRASVRLPELAQLKHLKGGRTQEYEAAHEEQLSTDNTKAQEQNNEHRSDAFVLRHCVECCR